MWYVNYLIYKRLKCMSMPRHQAFMSGHRDLCFEILKNFMLVVRTIIIYQLIFWYVKKCLAWKFGRKFPNRPEWVKNKPIELATTQLEVEEGWRMRRRVWSAQLRSESVLPLFLPYSEEFHVLIIGNFFEIL